MTNTVRFSLHRGLIVGLATMAIAACSTDGRVDAIYDPSAATPVGATLQVSLNGRDQASLGQFEMFRGGLATGYSRLSKGEYDESDYGDGDAFAAKAKSARSAGLPPLPYNPSNWMIRDRHMAALQNGHARLTEALLAGSAFYTGTASAEAQVAYDCWLQEVEEDLQSKEAAKCKAQFEDAMSRVKIRPAVKTIVYEQAAPVEEAKPETFIVYFPFDSATLLPREEETIREAAQFAVDYGTTDVRVGGYTDTMGTAVYNDTLSERRAQVVVDQLRQLGVPAVLVKAQSYGETNLQRQTGDEVREQANRRATISVYFD